MRLIRDLIERRLEVMKDLELNNDNVKAIWHFYQIYKICLNVLGITDSKIKEKDRMIIQLLFNMEDIDLLDKIKGYISKDSKIIEDTLNIIISEQKVGEVFEDFYPDDVIGVNIYDRGNL